MLVLKIIRDNIFKFGSLALILFTAVLVQNRLLTFSAEVLTVLFIMKLLMDYKVVKTSLPKPRILESIKRTVGFVIFGLAFVTSLLIVVLFAGNISRSVNGAFGIEQRDWLQFIGAFLSSIVGLVSGYIGAVLYNKINLKQNI